MLCAALSIFQANVQTAFAKNSTDSDSDGKPILTVGQPAPKLEVDAWLGEAAKEEITDFQSGQVYVVEFWATWCMPCIKNIPHLAELQQEYRNQGVTVIGITEDDADKVKAFLKRSLPTAKKAAIKNELSPHTGESKAGAESKLETYADCAAVYRFGSDPDGSSFQDYIHAAGESGIPVAFVVGKTGLIEWIGQPDGELGAVLDRLLSEQWDREEFAKSYRKKQQVEFLWQRACTALEKKDIDQVKQTIDELRTVDCEKAEGRADHLEHELEFLDVLKSIKTTPAVGKKRLEELFADMKHQSRRIFFTTWDILLRVKKGELELEQDVLISLARHCELAAESESAGIDEGILFDVAGRAMSQAGDYDAAAALFRRAIRYAEEQSPGQLKGFKHDLQECQEKQKNAASTQPGEGTARDSSSR